MATVPVTNIMDLNNDDYAVIDKDSGTVLGTNLALVRWSTIPEETRDDMMSSDAVAWAYAEEYGTPIHRVDTATLNMIVDQAEAWEAVANHPSMRRAMREGAGTGLEIVLAELDRLHALDQGK